MKLVLLVLVLLGIFNFSQQQFLIPPTKAYPEQFPYHAYVSSDLYCLGALISTRYVVVNAICIETREKATVYLGTRKDPYYDILESHGQKIHASELITHPQFSKRYSDRLLVNNIGLVKLREAALITSTVQPIRLPTKLDFPLMPGTLLNITGYMDSVFLSNTLRFTTVRVRSQSQCLEFYGRNIVTDDEQCVEGLGRKRLHWPGALAKNGVLVGLSRVLSREAECVASEPPCNPRDVFLSLETHLNWLYDNSDVPRSEPILVNRRPQFPLVNVHPVMQNLSPNLAKVIQNVVVGKPNVMITHVQRPQPVLNIHRVATPQVVVQPVPVPTEEVVEEEEVQEEFRAEPPKKGAER